MTWTDSLRRLAAQLTDHKPSLYPTEELDDLTDIKIAKLSTNGFEGERLTFALALKSGLHLFNESLDPSHDISQEIHTPTGSYWHGIMHRMEGDYGNAKYWFRMVGHHPVYDALADQVRGLLKETDLQRIGSALLREPLEKLSNAGRWDPYLFVDLVERQVTQVRDDAGEELLKEMQHLEMKLLLEYCYAQSGGGGTLLEPR
ncbi:hypothetical protein ACFQI7_21930 [Paenibacillus allorhizosphaerae]|uniref:Uncharacterized protein n=1 Tax=Paenibacillus allorhizosphaerae TaxID=2849866 RepID=A0ABN7TQ04_9BACL|nr:hypothetical protein [Paenibacillus allorhizosphaerae]CAG7650711.1 hypothetical protein PAECIP111802_04788 [Paenibacillus allorhizosphaerae]